MRSTDRKAEKEVPLLTKLSSFETKVNQPSLKAFSGTIITALEAPVAAITEINQPNLLNFMEQNKDISLSLLLHGL